MNIWASAIAERLGFGALQAVLGDDREVGLHYLTSPFWVRVAWGSQALCDAYLQAQLEGQRGIPRHSVQGPAALARDNLAKSLMPEWVERELRAAAAEARGSGLALLRACDGGYRCASIHLSPLPPAFRVVLDATGPFSYFSRLERVGAPAEPMPAGRVAALVAKGVHTLAFPRDARFMAYESLGEGLQSLGVELVQPLHATDVAHLAALSTFRDLRLIGPSSCPPLFELASRLVSLSLVRIGGLSAAALRGDWPALRSLTLQSLEDLDDARLFEVLPCLPGLEALSVECCPLVTGVFLSSLAASKVGNLQRLSLADCGVRVQNVVQLLSFTRLEEVRLQGVGRASAVVDLLRPHPALKRVELSSKPLGVRRAPRFAVVARPSASPFLSLAPRKPERIAAGEVEMDDELP